MKRWTRAKNVSLYKKVQKLIKLTVQSYFETLESDGHLCFIQLMIIDKHSVSR